MPFKDTILLEDQTGGVNSKLRPTKIKDNQFVSILGYDMDANSLRRAKGYTKLGTESDDTLTGKTLYKHEILSGTDILIKTIGTKIKYYDTVDDIWYLLTDATFTADLKWSFASFNGYLYGNNGTDNWIFWHGSAYSQLASIIYVGGTTDSYSETNKDGGGALYSGSDITSGQSFTNSINGLLSNCKFYLSKQGNPTGSAYAKIWNITGTYGSTSKPTGSALATSDPLDVSTVSSLPTFNLYTFTFSGVNQIELINGNRYGITITYNGGNSSNRIFYGSDASSPTHSGNRFSTLDEITWTNYSNDICFYVNLTTSTTIDLTAGHGGRFPTSGTIMIQDDVIAYSGKTGDQLTGVTGIATNHAAGSTVVLKLDSSTYSSLPKAREGKYTIAFHSNRLYYIDADNSRKVWHSKLADNVNPETDIINFSVAGSGAGDAGFGFAPDEIVAIKEFINGNNSSIVACFCSNGNVYAFVVTDGSSTTTNAFVPARTMNSYPINSNLVAVVENDLAMIDQFGHCRTLGYGDVNTPLTVKTISEDIEPSLEVTHWSEGCMFYFNRKLWLGGATISAGTNDIYYYHDSNYTSWGAYSHWDVVDFAEYNSALYGFSAVTGNVFKLDDSYSVYVDDTAENDEGPYYSEAVSKEFNFNEPHRYKEALKLRADGFITSNCEQYLDVYFDGALTYSFLIDGNNTEILGTVPNVAVGTIVFGQGVFGGSLPGGSIRKEFIVELAFNTTINFLKVQFRLRLTGKNVDFELTNLSLFAKLKGQEYWLPNKTITRN